MAIMGGFKDGGQVIVPVPLEFTGPVQSVFYNMAEKYHK
jgi:hypothetical protein